MCGAGCALPARSCGSGPAVGLVRPVLWYVPRFRGVCPAREQGAAAKEAPQPAPFATTRGLTLSISGSPLVVPCHRLRLCRESSDKPSAQNITRFHGGGKKESLQCQAGFKMLPLLPVPPLGVQLVEPGGSAAARPLRSVHARRALSGQTVFERLALAPASSVTACLVYNRFK